MKAFMMDKWMDNVLIGEAQPKLIGACMDAWMDNECNYYG